MTTRTNPSPATALAAPAQGLSFARGLLLLALAALSIAAIACGGSSNPSGAQLPDAITQSDAEVSPILTNHTLAVGENRFSLMLVDQENSPLLGADVHLRFFDLTGDEPLLKSEADTRFIRSELFVVDEGTGEETRLESSVGVYVTRVDFDTAGPWAVQISLTSDSRQVELIPSQFDVLKESPEPAVGDPAPASRQLTLADVADIAEIDSSFEPRPHMHDTTIADALAAGRPLVVAFATPAFCESRTCGPVMKMVMDPLYENYQDRAIFIHVEPLELKELREGTGRIPVEAAEEWNLQTQPWVFVIDAQGRVAGKFEGIIAMDEVEDVLAQVLEG
jgi:hypothetical protein